MASSYPAPQKPDDPKQQSEFWTIYEIAELLKVHPTTVTRMFEDEPGVLKLNFRRFLRARRPHVTLRIPDTVLRRKLRELGQ
jgi:hypothetical protein